MKRKELRRWLASVMRRKQRLRSESTERAKEELRKLSHREKELRKELSQ